MADERNGISRRTFCRGVAVSVVASVAAAAAWAQAPQGAPPGATPVPPATLPIKSSGLEHIGLTVPDPEMAAKWYGRIFNPQLFREREAPPRYYVTTGTAYLAFGGAANAAPLIDHICALAFDYNGRGMRPLLESKGITVAGVGMAADPDGLRLQLLGVPGGLAGTIVPGGRISLEPPALHAVALDHIVLRVSDVERSTMWYRNFFGPELARAGKKPDRVWFQIANTRLGLEPAGAGRTPAVDHFCLTVVGADRKTIASKLKALGVETTPSAEDGVVKFTDPHGFVVELKAV
jgi:catechol 2,3-dioxygenase-like lactoylglutathione lyase family enzyme